MKIDCVEWKLSLCHFRKFNELSPRAHIKNIKPAGETASVENVGNLLLILNRFSLANTLNGYS